MRTREAIGRVGDVLIGLVLIFTGACILAGLSLLSFFPKGDIWQQIGIAVGATAYTCVGELFILLGLKYVAGESARLTRLLEGTLFRTAVCVGVLMLAIVVVCVLLFLIW